MLLAKLRNIDVYETSGKHLERILLTPYSPKQAPKPIKPNNCYKN